MRISSSPRKSLEVARPLWMNRRTNTAESGIERVEFPSGPKSCKRRCADLGGGGLYPRRFRFAVLRFRRSAHKRLATAKQLAEGMENFSLTPVKGSWNF